MTAKDRDLLQWYTEQNRRGPVSRSDAGDNLPPRPRPTPEADRQEKRRRVTNATPKVSNSSTTDAHGRASVVNRPRTPSAAPSVNSRLPNLSLAGQASGRNTRASLDESSLRPSGSNDVPLPAPPSSSPQADPSARAAQNQSSGPSYANASDLQSSKEHRQRQAMETMFQVIRDADREEQEAAQAQSSAREKQLMGERDQAREQVATLQRLVDQHAATIQAKERELLRIEEQRKKNAGLVDALVQGSQALQRQYSSNPS